jgi:uncharacterized membrane-anchored protein YhcB (DUF1043 family)
MYLRALLVAQTTVEAGGGDTGIIVAVITAVGVVLAALITVLGQRNTARLDAIEKKQDTLGAAIERVERRLEDGLARLADRIDRLYSNPSRFTDLPPPSSEEHLERLGKSIRVSLEDLARERPDILQRFEVPDDLGEEEPGGGTAGPA